MAGIDFTEPSDAPLERGSVADFDAVFEAARPRLVRIVDALVGSRAAEDVVHDAYVAGRRHADEMAEPDELETRLIRLCIRRAFRAGSSAGLGGALARFGPPTPWLALTADRSEAQALVESLPPAQRTVIVLGAGYGYPFDRIATLVGTTPDDAGRIARQARTRLRRAGVLDSDIDAAARSLVVEPLPADVAEASPGRAAAERRMVLLRLAAALATGIVVMVAFALALGPDRLLGSTGGLATLRSVAVIEASLESNGWVCRVAASGGVDELRVCDSPKAAEPVVASIKIEPGPDGGAKGIWVTSDIAGFPTATTEDIRAAILDMAISLPFESRADADEAQAWLDEHLPMPATMRAATTVRGVRVAVSGTGYGYADVVEVGATIPTG
ncbi:MAG TPA: RNA polymerase sigma factor [Candidatus Limnocylindrales bacterium]|nr:RNA polymerase sigma factor [Candidatus Limnocylindrales bacterium]